MPPSGAFKNVYNTPAGKLQKSIAHSQQDVGAIL